MSRRVDRITNSINEAIAGLSTPPSEHCIFRVKDKLRLQNERAYEPEILSIGPYHHGKDKFQKMKDYKMWYLQQLLKRRNETSVDKYVTALINLEDRTRKCYAESINLENDEFVKMTLLDGFFIIELFRKWMRGMGSTDKNDPIQQNSLNRIDICCDLMLLENQLPYFILVELFNMTKDPKEKEDITVLAYYFLSSLVPLSCSKEDFNNINVNEIKHLLHLVHDCMCASFVKDSSGSSNRMPSRINSVTELQEAGIEFKKAEGSNSLLDIKFSNGLLAVPQLRIDDYTESVLRNLIAYEQFVPDTHQRYFTDYAWFLDCLVNSPKDATLLRCCGIIDNCLGDDDAVCFMLNKLTNGVSGAYKFSYSKVFNNMNEHCGKPWNIRMANLKHNYFNSPWALISFLAAVLLLLLTMAQTLFSVLSYV